MKDLIDLVQYVSPQRLKRLSFFFRGKQTRDKTYAGKLYQAIVDEKKWDDKTASKQLFGKERSSHYYKVKHELKQELINSVLLIDAGQKSRGTYYAGFLRCRKELYAADVLWVEGKVEAAIGVLKKLLPVAEELELPEIVIPVLQHLCYYNIVYKPNEKRFAELRHLREEWVEARNVSEKVREIFEQVYIAASLSAAPSANKLIKYEQQLAGIMNPRPKFLSAEVIFQACIVRLAAADCTGNYELALEICWDSIRQLDQKAHLPRGYKRNIYSQLIAFAIKTRKLSNGMQAVIDALRLVDEGDSPWFSINQLYFYLCLRSGEYERAVELCNRVFNHSKFSKQSEGTRERWILVRAHLSWLITVDPSKAKGATLQPFRLYRFLNSVPKFKKDILGFNVAIISIQLLWLIQRKDYDQAYNRVKSIQSYASRHLANAAGLMRTYYFVRLLTQLKLAKFKKSDFIKRAQPFLKSLSELTVKDDLQSVEVEIIPYETLYQEMLKLLDEKLH